MDFSTLGLLFGLMVLVQVGRTGARTCMYVVSGFRPQPDWTLCWGGCAFLHRAIGRDPGRGAGAPAGDQRHSQASLTGRCPCWSTFELAQVLSTTGGLERLAFLAVKLSGGRPFPLLVILCMLCFVVSCFLPNIAAILVSEGPLFLPIF